MIIGYAVVSADGKIADRHGCFPSSLRFDADRVRFQAALDGAALTVLGRRTHEATPNVKQRRRLVISRSIRGSVTQGPQTRWCNPDDVDLGGVLRALAGPTGVVAVAGGTGVYELIATALGYHAFELTVAERVALPGGLPLFSGCGSAAEIGRRLETINLALRTSGWLDRSAALRLMSFRRVAPQG